MYQPVMFDNNGAPTMFRMVAPGQHGAFIAPPQQMWMQPSPVPNNFELPGFMPIQEIGGPLSHPNTFGKVTQVDIGVNTPLPEFMDQVTQTTPVKEVPNPAKVKPEVEVLEIVNVAKNEQKKTTSKDNDWQDPNAKPNEVWHNWDSPEKKGTKEKNRSPKGKPRSENKEKTLSPEKSQSADKFFPQDKQEKALPWAKTREIQREGIEQGSDFI